MLNYIENSDVVQFIETVKDEHIKELLHKMHFEYSQYTRIGTVSEVEDLKKYADMKPSDYIKIIRNITQSYQDELESEKKGYEYRLSQLKNRKVGNE